ncbi:MAG: S-DNA-T family DNA segregation ATPase FtsK/SpoIIIE [Rhodococcus sp. (in: high G+C Gram-positive bacteria)]|jgi:S-DNA-T family DNA segregation ATPase FtsK/SpoIIIE
MGTIPITPRPAGTKPLNGETVNLPEVLSRDSDEKRPILQRILPLIMIVMMVGFVGLIIVTSGGLANINPMMMMMPMMMVPMLLIGLTSSAGGQSKVPAIKSYFLQLRESRKQVHKQGELMFTSQREFFPQPEVLASLIGDDDRDDISAMWTIGDGKSGGISTIDKSTSGQLTYDPYMAARIGLGTVELEPKLTSEPLQIVENLEPVTGTTHIKFMRTQRFVTGMPVAYHLGSAPFYRILGDNDEDTLALARAMVCSLAYNHGPDELALMLVCDDPDGPAWAPMKWLPHTLRAATGSTHKGRNIFRSVEEFMVATEALRLDRGPALVGLGANRSAPTPRIVVVIDAPDDTFTLPTGLTASGIAGLTFLIVRSEGLGDSLTIGPSETLQLENRKITIDTDTDAAVADAMTTTDFAAFARKMAPYRPFGFGTDNSDVGVVAPRTKQSVSFAEALGIDDIDAYDPHTEWERNAAAPAVRAPLGYVTDDTGKATGEILYLDIAETAKGGTGPTGALQGVTGSGKSHLIGGWVASMAAHYSPERLNFILMDFKGGATFIGFQNLPHVLAVITNLEREAELLARAQDVILGEITRRETLITETARAADITEYRKVATTRPDLPPLPDLLIVADEFKEFIQNNPQFMKLFESVSQKGRSLGMELLLASQYIDPSIIGNVGKNQTYGISLKASDASSSTQVIKSAAAVQLPIGTGDAYLHQARPPEGVAQLTRFRGFDIGAEYRRPLVPRINEDRTTRSGGVSVGEFDDDVHSLGLSLFTSISDEQPVSGRHAAPEIVEQATVETGMTIKSAVLARLAEITDIPAPKQLWLPTLKAPITAKSVGRAEHSNRLKFRIGVLDDPRHHRQLPLDIFPEGPNAHIRVLGAPGSGCSTTIEAIIAASAMSYRPSEVSFYIIDCGAKLQEVAGFPNVGQYARRQETELIDRLLGEFLRVAELRDTEYGRRSVTTFAAYQQSKVDDPIGSDPYGHMFLVIDGAQTFLSDDEDFSRRQRLLRILDRGRAYGIHVIAAGGADTIWGKIDPHFGLYLFHSVPDLTTSVVAIDYETRPMVKAMPNDQPGRIFELNTKLHGRVMLPHVAAVQPGDDTDPNNIRWNYQVDYGADIAAFGEELSRTHSGEQAERIVTVPSVLSNGVVWETYRSWAEVEPSARRTMPLGISAADLALISLPDTSVGSRSPHLIVAGDHGSGKTTMLRWLMAMITQQYKPDEAVIYLLDPSYSLLTERDYLRRTGHLARHGSDKATATAAVEEAAQIIASRQPTDPESLSAQDIYTRSWYTGPEIFVIADNVEQLTSTEWGVVGPINHLDGLLTRNDLGLHLYVSTPANTFTMDKGKGFLNAVLSTNPHTLLLSGTGTDAVFGSAATGNAIKFLKRRPGLGQLHSADLEHSPVIQTPHEPPWELPDDTVRP